MKEDTQLFNETAEKLPIEWLDSRQALALLMGSFRYSQGYPKLQWELFDWLHLNHPTYRISDTLTEQMVQSLRVPHAHNHSEIKKQRWFKEIKRHTDVFSNILQEENLIEKDALIIEISQDMIQRDFHYTNNERTNRRPNSHAYSPQADPNLSYLCYYGFLGNNAHPQEYQQLFQEVTNCIQENPNSFLESSSEFDNYTYKMKLETIIEKYNQSHPHGPVSF